MFEAEVTQKLIHMVLLLILIQKEKCNNARTYSLTLLAMCGCCKQLSPKPPHISGRHIELNMKCYV